MANPLLRWYAHLFFSERRQWILATNEATLLSLVFEGKGITSDRLFVDYFHVLLEDYLELLGVKAAYDKLVEPYAGEYVIAKTEEQVRAGFDERHDTLLQTRCE